MSGSGYASKEGLSRELRTHYSLELLGKVLRGNKLRKKDFGNGFVRLKGLQSGNENLWRKRVMFWRHGQRAGAMEAGNSLHGS